MRIRKHDRTAYRWLVIMTAIALIAMLTVQTRQMVSVPTVTVAQVERVTVEDTVVCAGTVQAAEGVEVAVDVPCVAGDVYVKTGDRVEEGDVLLTVDRTATLALAVSAGLPASQTAAASAALPEVVTAPQAGVVSAVHASKGDTLTGESPCVVLSAGGGVQIALTVRESVLPRLAVGQTVTVTGVAFEREAYTGTLSHIADSARNRVSGTTTETVVDAVVTLPASEVDASLLVGLNAKATVTVSTRDGLIVVPYEAVVYDEADNAAVYCVQNGTAFRRAVVVDEELPTGVVIADGLQAGEWLVTDAATLSGAWCAVETKGAA